MEVAVHEILHVLRHVDEAQPDLADGALPDRGDAPVEDLAGEADRRLREPLEFPTPVTEPAFREAK